MEHERGLLEKITELRTIFYIDDRQKTLVNAADYLKFYVYL